MTATPASEHATDAAAPADAGLEPADIDLILYATLNPDHFFPGDGPLLQEALGVKDGVVESLKATAAMALGDFERAESFAASATQVEPGLELGWWALLRTRTAAQDYEGAIEPLTALEERFGHLLIPQKLRRDRFLKVLIDQPAYQEWRAAQDAG